MKKYLLVLVGVLVAGRADAHYCSNIFSGPARLVVKPESATVHLTGTTAATLKVYLQNNFPFKLFNVKMQGVASGYTITVNPTQQNTNPGQNVLYTFTVKHNTGFTGDVQVSTLNLQVQIRIGGWRGATDKLVSQSPTQALLTGSGVYLQGQAQQTPSLNLAALFDKYPAAMLGGGQPTFSRSGIQQLIQMFGYRFCWDDGGTWACASQNCPSPCAEKTPYWTAIDQFPQDCMRAGLEIGVRKAKLGSSLQAARDAAVNAMKGGSGHHKCLAAVVGGLLWQGATSTTTFETALNGVSAACKAAGLRALGKGTAGNCSTGQYYEQAACAAAEGLQGVDAPVTSILMPNAGDGNSCTSEWQRCEFYAYMLYLVTGDRYGQGKAPTYYPQVGPSRDGGTPPKLDKGGPSPDGPKPKIDYGPHPDGWIPPDGTPPGQEAGPAGDGGKTGGGGCCRVAGSEAPPATSLLVLAALGLLLFVGRGRSARTRTGSAGAAPLRLRRRR